MAKPCVMSIQQTQVRIEERSAEDVHEAAFLAAVAKLQEDKEFARKMALLIDDRRTEGWLTIQRMAAAQDTR